jgi:hypothetical protein
MLRAEHALGLRPQRGMGIDILQRQIQPALLHLSHEPHSEHGMAAQFEEVVLTTDVRDVQHPRPHRGEHLFNPDARWLVVVPSHCRFIRSR